MKGAGQGSHNNGVQRLDAVPLIAGYVTTSRPSGLSPVSETDSAPDVTGGVVAAIRAPESKGTLYRVTKYASSPPGGGSDLPCWRNLRRCSWRQPALW